MDQVSVLRQHGLFDAKVPRYTSYPPANRFEPNVGARFHHDWLAAVPERNPLSLYVHIPFCRRLCWFCACRTQGTKTLGPVANYVDVLLKEIDAVALRELRGRNLVSRLHLGGGTPTLLSAELMSRLLRHINARFTPTTEYEFSVEIDPTEAAPEVLDTLARYNMTRASIGVQDFDPKVQQAIGRLQGYDLTKKVIATLRANGTQSLNIDFLYGLPHQTVDSLIETLDRVVSLRPDRLALYGYAHVPHMSKRQVMIPDESLPEPEERFIMSEVAKERLIAAGYENLGIDHFALPHDSLTKAAQAGQMTRNFQGYTDDPCNTLLGFGASAISQFRQGYVQNAVSTSAYIQRVESHGTAAHKGIGLTDEDVFIAALIEGIMCDGVVDMAQIKKRFPRFADQLRQIKKDLMMKYAGLIFYNDGLITLKPEFAAAARLIAAHLDRTVREGQVHSLAV